MSVISKNKTYFPCLKRFSSISSWYAGSLSPSFFLWNTRNALLFCLFKGFITETWEKRFLHRKEWSVGSGCTAEKQRHYSSKEWMRFLNNILNALWFILLPCSHMLFNLHLTAWCYTWLFSFSLSVWHRAGWDRWTVYWSDDVWEQYLALRIRQAVSGWRCFLFFTSHLRSNQTFPALTRC